MCDRLQLARSSPLGQLALLTLGTLGFLALSRPPFYPLHEGLFHDLLLLREGNPQSLSLWIAPLWYTLLDSTLPRWPNVALYFSFVTALALPLLLHFRGRPQPPFAWVLLLLLPPFVAGGSPVVPFALAAFLALEERPPLAPLSFALALLMAPILLLFWPLTLRYVRGSIGWLPGLLLALGGAVLGLLGPFWGRGLSLFALPPFPTLSWRSGVYLVLASGLLITARVPLRSAYAYAALLVAVLALCLPGVWPTALVLGLYWVHPAPQKWVAPVLFVPLLLLLPLSMTPKEGAARRREIAHLRAQDGNACSWGAVHTWFHLVEPPLFLPPSAASFRFEQEKRHRRPHHQGAILRPWKQRSSTLSRALPEERGGRSHGVVMVSTLAQKGPPQKGCPEITQGRFLSWEREELVQTFVSSNIEGIRPSLLPGRSVKFLVFFRRPPEGRLLLGLFKPTHRTMAFANHRGEIGAYRLSRLLGLEGVPPAVPMRLSTGYLYRLLEETNPDRATLFKRETFVSSDIVEGALLTYVPGARAYTPPPPLLDQLREHRKVSSPEAHALLLQLSDMLVLDYLSNNYDRLSGGNILKREERLIFIDNGAAFGREREWKRIARLKTLRQLGRVRRSTARALFALTRGDLNRCMGALLTPREREALLERRQELVAHLYRLHLKWGADAYFREPAPP